MFDIDEFLTTSAVDLNATEIRFKDNRSGEVFTRTIYRPGKRLNFNRLAEEMKNYGYTLMWMSDDPGDLPGKLNWSELFDLFLEQGSAV